MSLIQVKDIIKKSYYDLNMVSSYLDLVYNKEMDKEMKSKIFNMKKNINKMSCGIQQYITSNNSPSLEIWVQYIPRLRSIPELLSHENSDLNGEKLISMSMKINKEFKHNFELLSNMNFPEKVIYIFIDTEKIRPLNK